MSSSDRVRPAALAAGLAGAAGLLLSACASDERPAPVTPTEQFAIAVQTRPEEIRLAVHADGLSANQQRALESFASDWSDGDGGQVTIRAPSGGDPESAYRMAEQARRALARSGVDAVAVSVAPAGAGQPGVLTIAFERTAAVGPQCGSWDDLSKTNGNRGYGEFGCATTANIAAQIAYPADLTAPYPPAPPDAGRRQTVFDAWRAGSVTSSSKDQQANGAISSAIP